MGAGQSTPSLALSGAGSRELNTPGVFILAPNQRKFVDSMGVLLKVLLTEATNLGDLKELLKKSCSSLFMVNTGDPYTQMRLLQDPANPLKSRVLTVVPQEAYKTKYELEQRHIAMCTQYTAVLLRLTEVVLALFASIHINQGMAALKDLPNKVESLQRDPPDGQIIPMPSAILENYKSEGFFQEIEPNLYVFKPRPEVAGAKTPNPPHMVVFDVKKGLIYYAGTSENKGPVFRFSFSEKPVAKGVGSQIQLYTGSTGYNPGYGGFAFPRPLLPPSVPVGVAPQYMPPSGGQPLLTNPPMGGPSVGGSGGSGSSMTKEMACTILGLNPNEPLTQALVIKARKNMVRMSPNHGGAPGTDMDLLNKAFTFLKQVIEQADIQTPPSPIPPIPVPANLFPSELVRNSFSQLLMEDQPKTPLELQNVIEKAYGQSDAVLGQPTDPVVVAATVAAIAGLNLDLRTQDGIEALANGIALAPPIALGGAPDPLNNIEDVLLQLVEAEDQDKKETKASFLILMMNRAREEPRIGSLIAEQKRFIQMKKYGKVKNACLPDVPTNRDISTIVNRSLDIFNTKNTWGPGYLNDELFYKNDDTYNQDLEDYMKSIMRIIVTREWPRWQKAPGTLATSNCVRPYQGQSLNNLPRRNARKSRRKTYRRSRVTRRVQRRKQRGGDVTGVSDYYILTIDTFPKSERSYQVVLTTQGVAMNPADIRNPNPTSTSKSLTDLFMKVILAETVSAGSTVASKFRPLDASDVGTYGKLMNIYETLMNVQEGPSLGAYRAFSLLSGVEAGLKSSRAYTYVCKDKMAGRRAGNEVQFATLESLYLDVQETEKPDREQKGKDKLRELVNELSNTRYTSAAGTTPTTLNDISIPSLITDPMRPLCDAQGVVIHSANVAALKKAHQNLRRLYDSHLSAVYSFIMKEFITIRASDKMILLNQKLAFPTNGDKITTIQKKLEDLVEKARSMIASYYIKVEKEYTATLTGLTAPF